MTTQIDWQRELDASFGSGEDVPVGHYVAVGHTAVRRRRAAFSAAAVAATLVVGLTWTLAPGQAPRSTEAPLATDPSSTRSAEPDTTAVDRARSRTAWGKGEPPVRVLPDGKGPEVREGAVVHEVRNDLYPGKESESAAFDVTYDDVRWWVTLEWDAGGAAMTSSPAEDDTHDTFAEFVAATVATGGMTHGPAGDDPAMAGDLVTWHGGEVVPAPGVTVVRRVDDPVVGDESIGLVVRSEGSTTWMLLTQGGAAATWSLDTDSGWLTFDQWLADQVALQTGSPGLHLVKLAADGTVTATAPSVEVLEQRADPDLERYGTGDGGPSAVALLEWQGERWFVLAVRFPENDAVTTVAAAKAGGAETLDEFVAFMADKADEGGMR
ncbi:hypothetical protein [Nocardioides sp.]|uniref:hypothetical protein n=1 Tax=Nocardioides sp. TaxID=35761 RepID=UPI0035B2CB4E